MRTTIAITGQINGNFKLRSAIITAECQESKLFSTIFLAFKTKKAAKKALSAAYKNMTAQEPGIRGKIGGINYSRGYALSYDASVARILD